jgi:oligosaccharyl transferase (archaeosortase A-associated)
VSEQSPEQKRKLPPIVIVGIILAAICGVSLYIRIALPYHQVFVNGQVWFLETDAYYYMRFIENLVHHFPHISHFDPYMVYPGGQIVGQRPFFAWLVSAIILLVRGASSLHTMEVIAAYVPASRGTLALLPVYFSGKELFNRWVGVISAALVAILPGEFLHRSLLGFTDHHVAEVLFSTTAVMFLIMAIKRAREREITFAHFLNRDWAIITKPLIYTLLAGIFFGIYLLAWDGALLFVFIIFVYLLIQFIVDHLRHKSTDYLCIVGSLYFFISYIMLLVFINKAFVVPMYHASFLVAILTPIVLTGISRLMANKAMKPAYYPLTLLGLVGIGVALIYAVDPSLVHEVLGKFREVFVPRGGMLTVMEVQSLTAGMAWSNFTTSFFISFISLVMLVFVVVKERSADKTLFLFWSVIILVASLSQRRFGYYYAVNVALLTGYFSWKMLDIAGLSKLLAKSKEVVGAVKKFKRKKKRAREKVKAKTFMQPRGAWVRVIVVGIIIFFLVFFPNIGLWRGQPTSIGGGLYIGYTRPLAASQSLMDEGWYSSLLWLKDNSPDPFADFDDPDFYYELYPPANEFEYPETAYGVMSWWDYGYFIMQIAHRIPNANPGQVNADKAGQFFTAQNESSANELADEMGSKYVMIDYAMATPAKFYAMAVWAGKSVDEFYEIYYMPTSNSSGQWAYLFYPAYYNSTVVRLYNFDGKAVNATQPAVISYEEMVASDGTKYKEITWGQYFSSYEDAQAYAANQTSGNYRIVGVDPFTSPVPLEALNSYQLVYPLNATITATTVKVFEYLGSGQP